MVTQKPVTKNQKLQQDLQKELEIILEEIEWRKDLVLKIFFKTFKELVPLQEKIDTIDQSALSSSNDLKHLKEFLYIRVDEFLNLVNKFETNQVKYLSMTYDPINDKWGELSQIKIRYGLISDLSDRIYFLENPNKTTSGSSFLALERGKRPY
jgi:hypothetical protein